MTILGPDVNASRAASVLSACPSSAGGAAVRLGLSYVRGVGDDVASLIAAGRPYRDMEDVVRRTGITAAQAEALATAGAFGCFGLSRRAALWGAGAVAAAGGGVTVGGDGVTAGDGVAPDEVAPAVARGPADKLPSTRRAAAARLGGLVTGADAPPLPDMDPLEVHQADLWATGLSPTGTRPSSSGRTWRQPAWLRPPGCST